MHSIIFGIGYLAAASGFYFYKKTDQKQNAITWLPITIVAMMCYHTFAAATIQLLHIPITLISMGVCNLIPGIYFWYVIGKKKRIQAYKVEPIDILFVIGFVGLIGFIALKRYGLHVYIHYDTIDPSAHFQDAMNVANNKTVSGMFFAGLNDSLFIQTFGPVFRVSQYYKLFIAADVCMLFVSALMFWALIRNLLTNSFLKIAGVIACVLYVLGYPLNNTIFGFVYLGMGVTLIGYLIFMTNLFLQDKLKRGLAIILLALGCLGIFECYVLFMPAVFFGIFFGIAAKRIKEKSLFTKEMVLDYLAIFLMPCIYGFMYTYFGVFSEGVTVGSAIGNEGHIYRDFFSNFIWLLPLALYGIIRLIKEKKQDITVWIFGIFSIFVIGMLYFCQKGTVSTYYYYKNYFVLWLLMFLLAFTGVYYLSQHGKSLILSGFATWVFIAGMYFFNIESDLAQKRPLLVPVEKAGSINDIYSYNLQKLRTATYSIDKIQLYDYVYTNLLCEDENLVVPLAGYWEDDYWYQGITNQRIEGYMYWNNSEEEYFAKLKAEAEYVLVLTDSEFYRNNQLYFDSLEKVYENNGGFLAKVN